MKRKQIGIIFACLVGITAIALGLLLLRKPSKLAVQLTPQQLEQYYSVYQVPQVIFVRKALNAYLARDSKNVCIMNAAVAENGLSGLLSGLDAFDETYYKSKFIVATINDNTTVPAATGDGIQAKDIQIVFQDKPDRMFYALVGKEPEGKEMCLLGFNSKEPQNTDAIQKYNEVFRVYLSDKEHAL